MKPLATRRLLLRPFTEADAPALFTLYQNPAVGLAAGWKPHESEQESLHWLRELFIPGETWAITLAEDGSLIGSGGFVPDEYTQGANSRVLGYALGEAYWGKGYMTEAAAAMLEYAFTEMKLENVTATAYVDNPASAHVLQKLGFRGRGCLKKTETTFDGTVHTLRLFTLTNGGWRACKQGLKKVY